MAWRNLWRNKRRTTITLASIFFAVILSTLMMSIKEGTYDNMIKTTAGDFNGYIQVHKNGYWEERTMDFSFEFTDSLKSKILEDENVHAIVERLESFALAATDSVTKGAMIFGINPEKEEEFFHLSERVISGEYINSKSTGVLIGKGLAEYLQITVGDTLVLLGQGYHAVSAAGKYAVEGIVKFGSPELSRQLIFIPLQETQRLFGAEHLVNNLALVISDPDKSEKIAQNLKSEIGDEYEVMAWQSLYPDLVNMIETDRVEGYVFMFILYMVISFGIFGTVLMMLAERRHEFGVLIAIGMNRAKLGLVVFLEVIIISVSGAILGTLGAFPICYYFILFPISYGEDVAKMAEEYGMEAVLKASIDFSIFFEQALVIAMVGIIIGFYPLIKLNFAKAINEMRS